MSGHTQNRPIATFVRCYANAVLPVRDLNTHTAYKVFTIEGGVVPSGQVKAFKTGLALSVCSEQFVPQLGSLNRLAIDAGVIVVSGIIDSGSRDEIMVVLFNTGATSFTVNAGDQIAQMHFVQFEHPRIAWADPVMRQP